MTFSDNLFIFAVDDIDDIGPKTIGAIRRKWLYHRSKSEKVGVPSEHFGESGCTIGANQRSLFFRYKLPIFTN